MTKLISLVLAALALRVIVDANPCGAWLVLISFRTAPGYIGGRSLCIAKGGEQAVYWERALRFGRYSLCPGLRTYITSEKEVIRLGAVLGSSPKSLRQRIADCRAGAV